MGESKAASASKHLRRMQRQARAVLDAHGVKMFRAEVSSVGARGSVFLRRDSSIGVAPDGSATKTADVKASVRLDGARRLKPGDWCWCLHFRGHAFVLGRTVRSGDVYIDDLAPASGTIQATQGSVFSRVLLRTSGNAFKAAWLGLESIGVILRHDKNGDGLGDGYSFWARSEDEVVYVGMGEGKRCLVFPNGDLEAPGKINAGSISTAGSIMASSFDAQTTYNDVVPSKTIRTITHNITRPKAFAWVAVAGAWHQLPLGAATADSFGCSVKGSSSEGILLWNDSANDRRFYLEIYR